MWLLFTVVTFRNLLAQCDKQALDAVMSIIWRSKTNSLLVQLMAVFPHPCANVPQKARTPFSWHWTEHKQYISAMMKIWSKSGGLQMIILLNKFSFSVEMCYLPRILLDNQHSFSAKVSLKAKIHNPTQAAERKLRNRHVNHPNIQGERFEKMDDHASSPGWDVTC